MALQIKLPTVRQFSLYLVEDASDPRGKLTLEAQEDSSPAAFVSFRQGTQEDNNQRTELISERHWMWDDDEGRAIEIVRENINAMAELEVGLTLTGTDIELPDVPLEFEGTPARVKNKASFKKWWQSMPPLWAPAIYEACVRVNPTWATKRIL